MDANKSFARGIWLALFLVLSPIAVFGMLFGMSAHSQGQANGLGIIGILLGALVIVFLLSILFSGVGFICFKSSASKEPSPLAPRTSFWLGVAVGLLSLMSLWGSFFLLRFLPFTPLPLVASASSCAVLSFLAPFIASPKRA